MGRSAVAKPLELAAKTMRRTLVVMFCLLLALFCGYGYLAAKEPGTPVLWVWVYGSGFLVWCAAAVGALLYRRT